MRIWILALVPTLLLAQGARALERQGFRENARFGQGVEDGPLAPQLHKIRINRLQDVMGLPPSQAQQIADRWGAYDREFIDHARQLQRLRTEFGHILIGPGSDEEKSARLKPLLEQFLDHRKRQVEAKNRFEDEIRAQLNPAQQARFIMLVENITRRIQEGLRKNPGFAERMVQSPD